MLHHVRSLLIPLIFLSCFWRLHSSWLVDAKLAQCLFVLTSQVSVVLDARSEELITGRKRMGLYLVCPAILGTLTLATSCFLAFLLL